MHTSLAGPGTCPVLQFWALVHSVVVPPPAQVTVQAGAAEPRAGPAAARTVPPVPAATATGRIRQRARFIAHRGPVTPARRSTGTNPGGPAEHYEVWTTGAAG
jgi:hypothetical protein